MLATTTFSIASGFKVDAGGTHTSRTIMLAELRVLLAMCPVSAELTDYESAILDDNVLHKRTHSTRRRTLRGLRELYALDSPVILFRALRDLWASDTESQPLLALLCAAARDPILQTTAPVILSASKGTPVTASLLAAAVEAAFVGHYNPDTLAKIGRNCASSWTQSGHLSGRVAKRRTLVEATPVVTAYALFLGYLNGSRGDALFHTLWARVLDAPEHLLREHALTASRQGWLEYKHAGTVTEVTFQHLMRHSTGETE